MRARLAVPNLAFALTLAGGGALALVAPTAAQLPAVHPDSALAHVRTLADDRYGGRAAGSPESDSAAAYVARAFAALGLVPLDDDTHGARGYLQPFSIAVGLSVDPASTLRVGGRELELGRDWLPFDFAASGTVRSPVIFADGADLTQAEAASSRLDGRIAVLSDVTETYVNPHTGGVAEGPRYWATMARNAGAAAVIILTDSLRPLSLDEPPHNLGIPAVQLRRSALGGAAEDAPWALGLMVAPARAPTSNVVAMLRGRDPALRNEAVIVGAHYDHLGLGGSGSLAPDVRAIHNGADDNASGVAALLEAARALAAAAPPRRTIVFAAFGAEEKGLLGSSHYVDRPPIPLDRTVAMLNLDMVGRLRYDDLHVFGVGTAQGFGELVESRAKALGFDLTTSPDGFGPSDHASFYAAGVPVLHFFTGTHADYHRPSDNWEKVNARGIARIAELTAALALEIADREQRPVYVAQARPQPSRGGDGYGAYLGTIPDFGEVSEGGVRISGVRADSPAETAGLEAGDVIVRFNERTIANLYDLTYALRDHTAGDTVRITVHRGDGEHTLTAVLGKRR